MMEKTRSRRQFLQGCSTAIAAMVGARLTHVSFGSSIPGSASLEFRKQAQDATHGPLVVIFLRGGWDGLSVVTPLGGEDRKNYELARPGIKIPAGSLLPLDDQFGMHPALAPLLDLYQDGKAAWIHAVGLNVDTRSHFDAQEFIDLGTPGRKSTPSGWITRHLMSQSDSLSGKIPILATPAPSSALLNQTATVSMNNMRDMNLWDNGFRDEQLTALRRLYTGETLLHKAGLRTVDVVQTLLPYMEQTYTPAAGVKYQDDEFSNRMKSVAQMIKMDVGLQVATVDYGGWDTHEYQNDGAGGYLGNLLANLGAGLTSFYQDLNDGHTENLSVIVISEFGRRLSQNDSQGTDHGHGSLMLALGDGVNGGHVYGAWPGLANEQLYDRADLAVTTDFRQVLSELLTRRLNNPNIDQVFPDFQMLADMGVFAAP
jgi:uncharacterized protein (DUF1501 family)